MSDIYSSRLETDGSGQPGANRQKSHRSWNIGSESANRKRRHHPGRHGEAPVIGAAGEADKLGANPRGGNLGITKDCHWSGPAPSAFSLPSAAALGAAPCIA